MTAPIYRKSIALNQEEQDIAVKLSNLKVGPKEIFVAGLNAKRKELLNEK
jgi:hypothetical protein